MSEPDLSQYRSNVGIVLFHRDGRVWLGRRARTPDPFNWQFPQGGVDPGEDWEAAARRELREETGAVSVALLGETADWIPYDYPPELAGGKAARGWRGQKQKWFALRFLGEDSEFDLAAHSPAEFDAWRWGTLDEALAGVVPFKRDAYAQAVAAFRRFEACGPSGSAT
jgi:putative (di)nucleoside polyphosphate hydrolase